MGLVIWNFIMNKGKILFRLFLILLSFALLILLIFALTDVYPDERIEKYRFLFGIGFLTSFGFLRESLKKDKEDHPEE